MSKGTMATLLPHLWGVFGLNGWAMTNRLLAVCALWVGCATTQAVAPSYPLAELKALESQLAWRELLTKATEVAPTKRDDQWKALVEKAAVGLLEEEHVKDESTAMQALSRSEMLLKDYAWLKTAPAFMAKRLEQGVKAWPWLASQYRNGRSERDWVTDIVAFAETDTVTAQAAQRLGKEVVMKRLIPVTAFRLYQLAYKRDGAKLCADDGLPALLIGTFDEGSWGQEAADIATACWASVQPPLAEALKKAESKSYVKNVCAALKAKFASDSSCR
jgi:hypothetical protein